MPTDRVLLDTHALLWWQAESDRLSARAAAAIESVDRVWISAITLWEVATLTRLGRITLDRSPRRWAADLLAGPVDCLDVDPSIATAAGTIEGFHGDPADRIIYATARHHKMSLVTKDRRLTDFATAHDEVAVLW